jgi:hypothetical protein
MEMCGQLHIPDNLTSQKFFDIHRITMQVGSGINTFNSYLGMTSLALSWGTGCPEGFHDFAQSLQVNTRIVLLKRL